MEDLDEAIIPDSEEVAEPVETNQVETEEVKEEVKEKPKEENVEPKEEKVDEPSQMVKVKYLKEEKEIPMEEAIKYAQIGMNEERLSNKYKAELESLAETKRVVSELAKLNNISESEALRSIADNIERAKLDQIKGDTDIPDEIAKELLEAREIKAQLKAKEQESESNKQFTDFIQAYPDVKADSIPDEVWNINKQGVPLKYAYESYLLKQISTENKILKQNATNAAKADIPSTTENQGKVEVKDDFLTGFDSEL